MTEKKEDARLESQLHDLYNIPEPNSAFTRQLRAQVLEHVGQRRQSWLMRLENSLTTLGRITFRFAGAALLVALVLLSAALIGEQHNPPYQDEKNAPGASITPEPTGTVKPASSTTEPIYKLLQLAPAACDTTITPEPFEKAKQQPEKILGGGVVKSGDYQISLYLFCDPSYHPVSYDSFSEIVGLGIYRSIWNENAVFGNEMVEYIAPLNLGAYLPAPSASEIPVRYVFRTASDAQFFSAASTSNELYGATLSFRLVKHVDGLVVEDIQIAPLMHNQLPPNTEPVTVARNVPQLDPSSVHSLLGDLKALQEAQKSWLYSGPGWIRYEEQRKVAGMANDPSYITWYEVDTQGNLLRYVKREIFPWGKNPPTTKTVDTGWVSSGKGMEGNYYYGPHAFDMGIYTDAVMAIKQGGTIAKQELPEGIEYTITTETWEIKAVFDPETGRPIKSEYYDITQSEKKKLTSRRSGITLERVDEPPPDVLKLLD